MRSSHFGLSARASACAPLILTHVLLLLWYFTQVRPLILFCYIWQVTAFGRLASFLFFSMLHAPCLLTIDRKSVV